MQSLIPFFYLLLIVVFEDSHRRHVVEGEQTCPKNCKSYLMVPCNHITGECSEGCNVGYYGLTCNETCQCDGGGCNFHSGECVPKSTKDKSSQKTTVATKGGVPVQGDCNSIVIPLAVCLALCAAVGLVIFVVYRYRQKIPHPSEENEQKEQRIPLTNPNPEHNQESRLDVTASNTNLLVYKLGVYILQPKAEGGETIILQCVHLKYDFRKINIDTTRVNRNGFLVNEPDTRAEEFEGRFKKFHGTTTTHPTLQMDCPIYWEVFCNVTLTGPVQTDVLLCIGLCREEYRDVWYQTPLEPNCYNLNVGPCGKHNGICAKIYRDACPEELFNEETNIKNTAGQTGELKFGILVNKENGTIAYFDLNRTKSMCPLKNVDFTRPLWPVFCVFGRSGDNVRMKLNTGRDIDMTPEKKDMIRDALIKTAG